MEPKDFLAAAAVLAAPVIEHKLRTAGTVNPEDMRNALASALMVVRSVYQEKFPPPPASGKTA